MGTDVHTCFINHPLKGKKKLGMKHPYIVFVIKNVPLSFNSNVTSQLKKFVSLMIEILDDKNIKRKFIANNFQVK